MLMWEDVSLMPFPPSHPWVPNTSALTRATPHVLIPEREPRNNVDAPHVRPLVQELVRAGDAMGEPAPHVVSRQSEMVTSVRDGQSEKGSRCKVTGG